MIEDLTTEEVDCLDNGKCPDCGAKKFLELAHGGNSVNILCNGCGAKFNVVPSLIGPFGKERLTRPDPNWRTVEQFGKALTFERELEHLINRYSMENGSDTPDFILASYLHGCLIAWNNALQLREKWYGRYCGGMKGIAPQVTPPPDSPKTIPFTARLFGLFGKDYLPAVEPFAYDDVFDNYEHLKSSISQEFKKDTTKYAAIIAIIRGGETLVFKPGELL